jgi:hypothetical protein
VLRDKQNQLPHHLKTMSDDGDSLQGSLSTIDTCAEKRSGKDSELASAARLLLQQDSKRVRRSKLVVLLMICIAAVATSIAVYTYAKGTEEADFEVRVST